MSMVPPALSIRGRPRMSTSPKLSPIVSGDPPSMAGEPHCRRRSPAVDGAVGTSVTKIGSRGMAVFPLRELRVKNEPTSVVSPIKLLPPSTFKSKVDTSGLKPPCVT